MIGFNQIRILPGKCDTWEDGKEVRECKRVTVNGVIDHGTLKVKGM